MILCSSVFEEIKSCFLDVKCSDSHCIPSWNPWNQQRAPEPSAAERECRASAGQNSDFFLLGLKKQIFLPNILNDFCRLNYACWTHSASWHESRICCVLAKTKLMLLLKTKEGPTVAVTVKKMQNLALIIKVFLCQILTHPMQLYKPNQTVKSIASLE